MTADQQPVCDHEAIILLEQGKGNTTRQTDYEWCRKCGAIRVRLAMYVWDESESSARITALEQQLATAVGALADMRKLADKLATHAGHYGSCPLNSWNKRLTKCACGLFQALATLKPEKGGGE